MNGTLVESEMTGSGGPTLTNDIKAFLQPDELNVISVYGQDTAGGCQAIGVYCSIIFNENSLDCDDQYQAGRQSCIDDPESCGLSANNNETCAQVITYGQVPNTNCWVMFPTPCDVPEGWQTTNEEPEYMCGETTSGDDRYDEGYSAAIADVKADPSAYDLFDSCEECDNPVHQLLTAAAPHLTYSQTL